MKKLIYLEDAIDALEGHREKPSVLENDYNFGRREMLEVCIDEIESLPSAEPERKTGRWMLAEDGWYCSACELYPPFDCDPEEKGIPYCPNCGAKMEDE